MIDSQEKINICLTLDNNKNFLWGCAVTITSLIENYKGNKPLEFFIITNMPKKNKEILKHATKIRPDIQTNINFIQDPEKYKKAGLKSRGYLPLAAFIRLYIPELLPKNVERCIYLDCDTIVETDIIHLWNINLKGKPLGAALDFVPDYLKIVGFKKCFNTGVLLMDLKKFRERNISNKAIKCCQNNINIFRLLDQDGLNVVLKDDFIILPSKWNIRWIKLYEKINDSIFHNCSKPKLWDPYLYKINTNALERFFYYTDKTLLKGKRPPKKNTIKYFYQLIKYNGKIIKDAGILRIIKRNIYCQIWKKTIKKLDEPIKLKWQHTPIIIETCINKIFIKLFNYLNNTKKKSEENVN